MRAKLILFNMFTICIILFSASCSSKKANTIIIPKTPIDKVLKDFKNDYPDALSVHWEQANIYQKANFSLNNYPSLSIYNNMNSDKVLSNIGYDISQIPKTIISDLSNNFISTTDITTFNIISQKDIEDLYLISTTKQGIYWYNKKGYNQQYIKQTLNTIPSKISDYINTHYHNHVSVASYSNPNTTLYSETTLVEIIHDDILKSLYFDNSDSLLFTYWYSGSSNLPSAISSYLSKMYSEYTIYRSRYMVYGDRQYYEITLTKPKTALLPIRIDRDGKPVLF